MRLTLPPCSRRVRWCPCLRNVDVQVGDTGSTVVEESQTLGDEVEFTEGLTIDRGFLSPYFINDQERSLCEMKNPKVH